MRQTRKIWKIRSAPKIRHPEPRRRRGTSRSSQIHSNFARSFASLKMTRNENYRKLQNEHCAVNFLFNVTGTRVRKVERSFRRAMINKARPSAPATGICSGKTGILPEIDGRVLPNGRPYQSIPYCSRSRHRAPRAGSRARGSSAGKHSRRRYSPRWKFAGRNSNRRRISRSPRRSQRPGRHDLYDDPGHDFGRAVDLPGANRFGRSVVGGRRSGLSRRVLSTQLPGPHRLRARRGSGALRFGQR